MSIRTILKLCRDDVESGTSINAAAPVEFEVTGAWQPYGKREVSLYVQADRYIGDRAKTVLKCRLTHSDELQDSALLDIFHEITRQCDKLGLTVRGDIVETSKARRSIRLR